MNPPPPPGGARLVFRTVSPSSVGKCARPVARPSCPVRDSHIAHVTRALLPAPPPTYSRLCRRSAGPFQKRRFFLGSIKKDGRHITSFFCRVVPQSLITIYTCTAQRPLYSSSSFIFSVATLINCIRRNGGKVQKTPASSSGRMNRVTAAVGSQPERVA